MAPQTRASQRKKATADKAVPQVRASQRIKAMVDKPAPLKQAAPLKKAARLKKAAMQKKATASKATAKSKATVKNKAAPRKRRALRRENAWPDLTECRERHAGRDRYLWCPFKVPQQVAQGLQATQKKSKLLSKLPNELLVMIFDRVTNPAGQVDLAMTCRRLLGVASLTTIMVPSTDMHSVGIHPHQKACTGMIDFQERMWPRDSEGRPASSWILCRWCYVLRPRSKEYWYPREKLYEPFRGKVEFDIPSIFRRGVEDWGAPQFANPCPDCAVQFYIPTCDQSRRRFVYQYTNPLPARKSPRSALPVKISEEDLRILGWHWDDDSEQSGGNGDHQASDDTQQAGDM